MPGLSLASWEASFPKDLVPATAFKGCEEGFSPAAVRKAEVAVGMYVHSRVLHLSLTYCLQLLSL